MAGKRPVQTEITFGNEAAEEGFNAWRAELSEAMKRLSRELGIPLGADVEVWLHGQIRLRGRLLLDDGCSSKDLNSEEKLSLRVQGVAFKISEMISCVRLS